MTRTRPRAAPSEIARACASTAVTVSVNNMVNETGKPTIVLDMPYQARQEDIVYIARQFREVIKFLEENLKVKYDFDRLKHACEIYNKMMENVADWVELRRPRPSAQPSETVSVMAAVVTVFSGHQSGLDYAKETLKELKNFRDRGVRTVAGDEVRAGDHELILQNFMKS